MLQMYIILGWMGWITLVGAIGFVIGYLKAERDAKRAAAAAAEQVDKATTAGVSPEVTASDEKQS
jgi:hypothetical protein